jgi:hypothetical protein
LDNILLDPDKDDRKPQIPGRPNRAFHGDGDSAIPAHGIKGHGHATAAGQQKR